VTPNAHNREPKKNPRGSTGAQVKEVIGVFPILFDRTPCSRKSSILFLYRFTVFPHAFGGERQSETAGREGSLIYRSAKMTINQSVGHTVQRCGHEDVG
jgi:hypothetical protein